MFRIIRVPSSAPKRVSEAENHISFYFRTFKGFYIFGWRRMILSNGGNLMNDAGACH